MSRKKKCSCGQKKYKRESLCVSDLWVHLLDALKLLYGDLRDSADSKTTFEVAIIGGTPDLRKAIAGLLYELLVKEVGEKYVVAYFGECSQEDKDIRTQIVATEILSECKLDMRIEYAHRDLDLSAGPKEWERTNESLKKELKEKTCERFGVESGQTAGKQKEVEFDIFSIHTCCCEASGKKAKKKPAAKKIAKKKKK